MKQSKTEASVETKAKADKKLSIKRKNIEEAIK